MDESPPARLSVALKEWQVVCDLLGEGAQILLLRKGGIQEGQNRFEIAHRQFALLPTRLHQDPALLKPGFRDRIDAAEAEPASFHLTHAGSVTDILSVQTREQMDRLDDLHCWAPPYIDMRFNYRPERPLYLLIVRAYRLAAAFDLPNTYEVAGCRSWVPLPAPLGVEGPVMENTAFARRVTDIHDRLRPNGR